MGELQINVLDLTTREIYKRNVEALAESKYLFVHESRNYEDSFGVSHKLTGYSVCEFDSLEIAIIAMNRLSTEGAENWNFTEPLECRKLSRMVATVLLPFLYRVVDERAICLIKHFQAHNN